MGLGKKENAEKCHKIDTGIPKICYNCKHWKPEQRELNYLEDIGFCTNENFMFNTTDGRLLGVYDKNNLKDVEGNPTHDFEAIKGNCFGLSKQRYILQTQDVFGCNQFSAKKRRN